MICFFRWVFHVFHEFILCYAETNVLWVQIIIIILLYFLAFLPSVCHTPSCHSRWTYGLDFWRGVPLHAYYIYFGQMERQIRWWIRWTLGTWGQKMKNGYYPGVSNIYDGFLANQHGSKDFCIAFTTWSTFPSQQLNPIGSDRPHGQLASFDITGTNSNVSNVVFTGHVLDL